MSSATIYFIILAIVIFGYLIDLFLGYLNTTTWSDLLPAVLKGIYDEEKYREQQRFERVKYRFGLLTGALSFLLMIGMLLFGGFALIDSLVHNISRSSIIQALLFFGIIGLAADILTTPFDIYNTFVIEQKFGFNTTTVKTYLADKLKGWLLAALLGGGILAIVVLIYEKTGTWFWILAWAIVTFFTVFVNYFYTLLILPIFNKLTPLEAGELRDAIQAYASKAGFSIRDVYVIDGSKRSKRGNAFFSGFGRQKRIVLYDTLIADHTVVEMVAILAHEVGHYKKKHILKCLIISILHTAVLFFILSLLVGNPLLSQSLGSEQPSFQIGMVAFGILYSPVSLLLGLAMNLLSRKHEYEADRFAAISFNARYLQDALKALSVKNLSNLTPHPWYVFFHYSHPTLLQRLAQLEKYRE